MQKITIKNLGPVQDFSMDVCKFNLLIGEQATGKSTIAKCIYFFRTIKTYITYYLQSIYDSGTYSGKKVSKGFRQNLKGELKSVFISLFGYSWDLDNDLYLKYNFTQSHWIDVCLKGNGKKYISVRFSQKLYEDLKKLEDKYFKLNEEKSQTFVTSLEYITQERIKQHNQIKEEVDNIFEDTFQTYYIPAGRSILTLLASNRTSINFDNLDLVTRQFMQLIESIHNFFNNGIHEVHKYFPNANKTIDVSSLSKRIVQDLKGDYKRFLNGSEYLFIDDKQIPINFISSGQQEVLWLLNLLHVLILKKEKSFVIIEEPEAHLYPSLQQEIINLIVYFSNINNSSVLITTHSPYVLTISNVYYCAGKILRNFDHNPKMYKIKKEILKQKIYKIIEQKRELSPDNFSAYKLDKDHINQPLVNKEFNEISTELIDEISENSIQMYMDLHYLDESSQIENEKE